MNYEKAMTSPDSDKWLKAMKSEIGSHVWEQSMNFGRLARRSVSY
jgi:hypothetical protein